MQDSAVQSQGVRVREALFEAALTGRPLLDVAAVNKVSIVAVLRALRGLQRQDPEVRQLVEAHSAIVDLQVEGLRALSVKRVRALLDADGHSMTPAECRAAELTRRTAVAVLRLMLPEKRPSAAGGGGGSWMREDQDERRAAELFREHGQAAQAISPTDHRNNGRGARDDHGGDDRVPDARSAPASGDDPWFEREEEEERDAPVEGVRAVAHDSAPPLAPGSAGGTGRAHVKERAIDADSAPPLAPGSAGGTGRAHVKEPASDADSPRRCDPPTGPGADEAGHKRSRVTRQAGMLTAHPP